MFSTQLVSDFSWTNLTCSDNSKVLLKKKLTKQVRRNTLRNSCHRRNKNLKSFVS